MKKIMRYIEIIRFRIISKFVEYLVIKFKKNLIIKGRVTFLGIPKIRLHNNSKIVINSGVVIDSLKYKNPLGLNKRSNISTIKENAIIEIGEKVGMSGVTICCMEKIIIGDNVGIGANTTIVDTNFHPTDPTIPKSKWDDISLIKTAPVIIEENVMIGMNVVILKGVTIGKNSVIGANCVIARDVEAGSIIVNKSSVKVN